MAADSRRTEFDIKNEVILNCKLPVESVFIGDSITHFWELGAFFCQQNGLIVNRGISWDVTEYLLRRFEADAIQLLPKTVIILAGINDTWALDNFPWSVGPASTAEAVCGGIVRNITQLSEMALKSGIQVAVCSILPTNVTGSVKNKERNQTVFLANQTLKNLAVKSGIIYVDYHKCFASDDGLTMRGGLSGDGIHPNCRGYEIMSDVLAEELIRN